MLNAGFHCIKQRSALATGPAAMTSDIDVKRALGINKPIFWQRDPQDQGEARRNLRLEIPISVARIDHGSYCLQRGSATCHDDTGAA